MKQLKAKSRKTLAASLLGNMLLGRRLKSKTPEREATIPGQGIIRAGGDTIRAGQNF